MYSKDVLERLTDTQVLFCKRVASSVPLCPKKPNKEKQILLVAPFANTKAEKEKAKQVARIISLEKA